MEIVFNTDDSVATRFTAIKEFFNQHERVEVVFKKKDGEIRVMPCTLKESMIPIALLPKDQDQDPPVSQETVCVFSFDKFAWRSFKTANVIKIASLTSNE